MSERGDPHAPTSDAPEAPVNEAASLENVAPAGEKRIQITAMYSTTPVTINDVGWGALHEKFECCGDGNTAEALVEFRFAFFLNLLPRYLTPEAEIKPKGRTK